MHYKRIFGFLAVGLTVMAPCLSGASPRSCHTYGLGGGIDVRILSFERSETATGGYIAFSVNDGPLSYIPTITYHAVIYEKPYACLSAEPAMIHKTVVSLAFNIRYTGTLHQLPAISPFVFSGIGAGTTRRYYLWRFGERSEYVYDGLFNFGGGLEIIIGKGYSMEIQGRYPTYDLNRGFSFSFGLRRGL